MYHAAEVTEESVWQHFIEVIAPEIQAFQIPCNISRAKTLGELVWSFVDQAPVHEVSGLYGSICNNVTV